MNKRTLVEFITGWLLVFIGGIVTILPILHFNNVRSTFIVIISLYGIIHLVKNFLILNSKEYSGFSTALTSLVVLILMLFLDIKEPWNLALLLFIWIILMSLTKLTESDYYHDHRNKLWLLNVVNLILFIMTGLITTINLFYTEEVQILILGFFFLINGILDVMDPLVAFIISKENDEKIELKKAIQELKIENVEEKKNEVKVVKEPKKTQTRKTTSKKVSPKKTSPKKETPEKKTTSKKTTSKKATTKKSTK